MFRKVTIIFLLASLLVQPLLLPQPVVAQLLPENLPVPGALVAISAVHRPLLLKGLKVDPNDPMRFDFLMSSGDSGLKGDEVALRSNSQRLIKYFLACLTIPEGDLWVNLSPYEKDRMIPDKLGQTELGRDLLAQDYILKQLTASLLDPNKALGKDFWERVHTKARELYGTSEIPLNTFNKVWILADTAKIFQQGNTAYLVNSHLKVMLDEDYTAVNKHVGNGLSPLAGDSRWSKPVPTDNRVGSHIIREIILPEIEREVNEGKNFATIRQIFHSFILASWYKKNLKNALLNLVYADKSKINGVNLDDPAVKEQIFEWYLQAYKKGVFNYIKEDLPAGRQGIDEATKETIPRRYFSGGTELKDNAVIVSDVAELEPQELKVVGEADLVVTADMEQADTESSIVQDTIAFGDLTQEQVRFLEERVNTLLEANNVFGGDEYDPVRVRLHHNQRGDPYFTQGTGFFYLDIPVNPSGTIRDLLQAIEALLDDVLKVKVSRFSGWNALYDEAIRIVYKGPQKHTDRVSSNKAYRSRRDRDANEKAALARLEMAVMSAQTPQAMDELIEEINESDVLRRKSRGYLLGLADRYYPQALFPDSAMTAREGEGVEFASIDHPQTWQETERALAPRIDQFKFQNEHSASGIVLFLKRDGIVWNWNEHSAPHITMAIQAGLMGEEDKRYIGTRVYVVDGEVELTIPALDSLDDFIRAADILGLDRDRMPRVKADIKQNGYFMDYLRRQIYLTAKLLAATEPIFGRYKLSTGSESLFDSYQGNLGDFLKAYAHLDDGAVVVDAAMSAGLFTPVELKNQAGVMPRILADFSWAIVDYMMKEPLWWPLFNGEPVAVKDINSEHLRLPIGFGVIEREKDAYVLSQATKKVLKAIQFVHSDQVFQFLNANRLPVSYPGQDTQMIIKVFSQTTPLYVTSQLLQGYIYYCRMDSKEDFILLKPFLKEDGIAVLRLTNEGKDWQMTEVANGKAVSLDYDGGRIDISYVNGTGAVSIKGNGHLAVMAQARTDSAMKSWSIEEYADRKDPQTWEEARAALGVQVKKLNSGQSDSIGVIAFGQGKAGTAVVWKMGARYNSHHHHLARDIFGYTEPLMNNKYPGLQIRINKEERSVELTPALGDLKRYVQEAEFLGLKPDDVPRRGSDIVQNTAFLKFLERQVYLTAKLVAQADEEVAQYSLKIGSRRIFADRKQESVKDFVTRYASLEDVDKAMSAQETLKGGIDLKASDLQMNISNEGSGMALHVDAGLLKQLRSDDFKGLVPVVIRITPIEGAWQMLGLEVPEDKRLKVAAV